MNYEYSELGSFKPSRRKFRLVNLLKVLGGVFILILIIEALNILIGNLTIKPVVAQWGVIEKGIWAEALFLRDETVINSPVTGDINNLLIDGTRVPAGEVIATIKANESESSQVIGFNSQAKLSQLNQERQTLLNKYQQILTEMNRKRVQLKQTPKNSKKIQSIDEALALLEQEKAGLLRIIHNNEDRIQQLTSKTKTEPVGTISLTIEKPGYLYYQSDGWEGRFGLDDFDNLSTADFERHYQLKSTLKHVQAGGAAAKLINPFHQTIALLVDTKQTGIPSEGDKWLYKVDQRIFQATVQQHKILPDGKMIIALDDTYLPVEFLPNRQARIFVIYQHITGVAIPVQSIFKKNQENIVRVVKGDGYQEEKVSIIETDGIKAIVNGIEFGTTIFSR